MVYVGKGRREDLFVLATELNLKFDKSMTIATLKDLIIGSESYDEELTKNIHSAIVEDRKAKEKKHTQEKQKENLRIEEQKENLRIEEQKENLRIEEQKENLRIEEQKENLRIEEQKKIYALKSKKKIYALKSKEKNYALKNEKKNYASNN
ncbi:hypothetical protein TNCV_3381021 [Trichonephila clavipes]|nr:hypothetical protein TNCV_3381021 [Trichonephila clavipes]